MNTFEVDLSAGRVLLGAEGTDNEGLLHWSRLLVSDQLPSCSASVFDTSAPSKIVERVTNGV
jgi:hypothetical protein